MRRYGNQLLLITEKKNCVLFDRITGEKKLREVTKQEPRASPTHHAKDVAILS
jgi:hypothetical protein